VLAVGFVWLPTVVAFALVVVVYDVGYHPGRHLVQRC